MKKVLFYIGIVVVVVLLGLLALNAEYFWKQLKFQFGSKPLETAQNQEIEQGETGEANEIRIPSLDITAPIQYVSEVNEDVFQRALQDGVVHYPGTAEFGEIGNAYIFGHSSDMAFTAGDFKTVFALLPRIQKGAEIFVSNKEKQVFKYKVFDQFVAESTDVHLLEQNTDGKNILTVQTSYPIGTALKRYIVKAELVE